MLDAYTAWEPILVAGQLIFVMLAMGATLRPRDFVDCMREPAGLILGLTLVFLISPILALGTARLFGLEAAASLGLLIVAAMPGGSVSNLVTYLGKGNVALSIALSAIGTLLGLVTIPVVIPLGAGGLIPGGFTLPVWEVVFNLLVFVLLPVVVGMVLLRLLPRPAFELARWGSRIGLLLITLVVVGSIATGSASRPPDTGRTLGVIILYAVFMQQLAMLPFRLFGGSTQDRFAVGTEVLVRNINLAILLRVALFPPNSPGAELANGAMFVILCYGGTSLVVSIVSIGIHRIILRRGEKRARSVASTGFSTSDLTALGTDGPGPA